MRKQTVVLIYFTLLAGSAAHASGFDECYDLKLASMQNVARDLQVPESICVDSISVQSDTSSKKPGTVVVQFEGLGLESVLRGTVSGPANERTVRVVALDKRRMSGICSEAASAYLTMTFKLDASGKRTSELNFDGMLSYTSDDCHLSGDSEYLEYVRH